MKIKIDPAKKITLYNPEFDEMRNDLDVTLRNTLKSMLALNMTSATVGLKIDIELIKEVIKDDNAPTGQREAMKPEIAPPITQPRRALEAVKPCKPGV